MIKKLFTLLTLALLAMPLAWGADYYLVGDVNSWSQNDQYKFTGNNGTYTLEKEVQGIFKIIKVNADNSWTWYGAENNNKVHISGMNHTNMVMNSDGSAPDYYLRNQGTTSFSFTLDISGNPHNLCINRDGVLAIKGDFNNWQEEAMTATSTGWTISKAINKNQKFGFVDVFGEYLGNRDMGFIGGNGNNHFGDVFNLYRDGGDLEMGVDGNYILNVRSLDCNLVVYENNTEYSKSLAQIEEYGVKDMTFTVNEPLQVVYVNTINNKVFARDLTGTTVTPNGTNYMTAVAKEPGSLEQYNWVMLDFTGTGTDLLTSLSDYPNPNPNTNTNKTNNNIALIQGLKGVYTDDNNYTIKVTDITTVSQGTAFTPNVYCPANFQVDGNGCQTGYKVEWVTDQNTEKVNMVVDENSTITYWFMTPKPMEVFELSGALWCGDGFYMEGRDFVAEHIDLETGKTIPAKWYNPAGLKGGIGLDKSCNSTTSPDLTQGQSYRFLTVAWKKVSGSKSEASYDEPLRISLNPEPGSTLNTTIQAGAINLTGAADQIVTGVSEVKTGGDVVSVTYCDLAGRMSQKPFAGVNIIVTRYSDGTVKTTKAIK